MMKVERESHACGDIVHRVIPVVVRSLINEQIAGAQGQDAGRAHVEIVPALKVHDRLIRTSYRFPPFAIPAAKMEEPLRPADDADDVTVVGPFSVENEGILVSIDNDIAII